MTYPELAGSLEQLAAETRQAAPLLEGSLAADKAQKLASAAQAFGKVVAAALRGGDPHAQELRRRLHAPDALDLLTKERFPPVAAAMLGAKKFALKKSEALEAARGRAFEQILETGRTEAALAHLDHFLRRATRADPPPTGEQALRDELLRVGGLGAEQFELELQTGILSPDTLRDLARTAGIKPGAKGLTPKQKAGLYSFARQLRENTLGWKS